MVWARIARVIFIEESRSTQTSGKVRNLDDDDSRKMSSDDRISLAGLREDSCESPYKVLSEEGKVFTVEEEEPH